MLLFQIATDQFWGRELRWKEGNAMCDALAPAKVTNTTFRCVTASDCCYLIALWYCYEGVIAWHKKRVEKTLKKCPEGHTWKEGEPQPANDEAKAAAIGNTYWTQDVGPEKRPKRHYFEPKPTPKVSEFGGQLVDLEAVTSRNQANLSFSVHRTSLSLGGACHLEPGRRERLLNLEASSTFPAWSRS